MMEGGSIRSRISGRDWVVLAELTVFTAIGGLTTCVDFILFNLLIDVFPAMHASVCGYLAGMIVAWLLNSRYTFGSGSRRLDFGVFFAVNVAGLGLTAAAVQAAALGAPGDVLLLNLTKLCAGGLVMLLRFVVLRAWTAGLWWPPVHKVDRFFNTQSR
jgi:putative flippase GtrA